MEGVVITIEDSTLRSRVESLLAKGDFVESLTAPTVESPFPLWIWHDVMKIWIGDRWKKCGYISGLRTIKKPEQVTD